jgi:hypothetical protein
MLSSIPHFERSKEVFVVLPHLNCVFFFFSFLNYFRRLKFLYIKLGLVVADNNYVATIFFYNFLAVVLPNRP